MNRYIYLMLLLATAIPVFAVPSAHTGRVSFWSLRDWISNREGIYPEDSSYVPNIGRATTPFDTLFVNYVSGSLSGTADSAAVSGHAGVADSAVISAGAYVADSAVVAADAHTATLADSAVASGRSTVADSAVISAGAYVADSAVVAADAHTATLADSAVVAGTLHNFSVGATSAWAGNTAVDSVAVVGVTASSYAVATSDTLFTAAVGVRATTGYLVFYVPLADTAKITGKTIKYFLYK